MDTNSAVVCREVQHGSGEYRRTVALRDEILRRPLGLAFTQGDLGEEADSFHLACWQDDEIAACVVLRPLSDKRIRVRQLAVVESLQGKGFGTRLVAYSELFADGHGYREMVLHAREEAVGFYERQGYSKRGEKFTEVTLPHFEMWKAVGGRNE